MGLLYIYLSILPPVPIFRRFRIVTEIQHYVLRVRSFVRMYQRGFLWKDSCKIWYWELVRKSVKENPIVF